MLDIFCHDSHDVTVRCLSVGLSTITTKAVPFLSISIKVLLFSFQIDVDGFYEKAKQIRNKFPKNPNASLDFFVFYN